MRSETQMPAEQWITQTHFLLTKVVGSCASWKCPQAAVILPEKIYQAQATSNEIEMYKHKHRPNATSNVPSTHKELYKPM